MASTPALCPALLRSPLARAQRLLPSMMMATWRGTKVPCRVGARRESDMMAGSDFHQIRFLGGERLIHPGDVAIGDLLDLFLGSALLVLADFLFANQVADAAVDIARSEERRVGEAGRSRSST